MNTFKLPQMICALSNCSIRVITVNNLLIENDAKQLCQEKNSSLDLVSKNNYYIWHCNDT